MDDVLYSYMAFIGDDKKLIHYRDLMVDRVRYGENIAGVSTPFGSELVEWLNLHNVVLPIEENYEVEYEKTDDEVIKEIQDAVQYMLDSKAHEKLYDNGFALASYANSTIEKFRNEAMLFITWRDHCWMKCYEILEQYQSGQIERPDTTYVLERLPTLSWNEENQ